jgi:hypothetical protein
MYTRHLCDKLGGDYFPRKAKCLIDGKFCKFGDAPPKTLPIYEAPCTYEPMPYTSRISEQPYYVMLGVVGAVAVGWYIFGGNK